MKQSVCHSCDVVLIAQWIRFRSDMTKWSYLGSPLTFVTYVFIVVTADCVTGDCMFKFMGPLFLYFFQNILNFQFRV